MLGRKVGFDLSASEVDSLIALRSVEEMEEANTTALLDVLSGKAVLAVKGKEERKKTLQQVEIILRLQLAVQIEELLSRISPII